MRKDERLFIACVLALVATSFGFVSRALLVNTIGVEFALTESQKGAIQGAGLFPFALSIIFFSLIVDRIGYGRVMVFAWFTHIVSALITITAHSYTALYTGTLLFSLANGTIEAVVNPVTTTIFPQDKTQRLNMLHSGWAGGLALGGVVAIAMGGFSWRWRIAIFIVPTIVYGLMLIGQRFPIQERVAAGVSYSDMLKEFGWASCFIVCIFICYAINDVCIVFNRQILSANHEFLSAICYSLVPTSLFALKLKSFGRPLFVFLLLVMVLSATTELGTDSWITDLLTPAMSHLGIQIGWVLVYTSAIMLVLRLCAGPLLSRFSPLGLLMFCSAITTLGLLWIAHAGAIAGAIFGAATLYGAGKAFFWPTTLGVVSEQFPKGGTLTLNAISGVGMISVGVLGASFLGTLQDVSLDKSLYHADPAIHRIVALQPQTKYAMTFQPLDKAKIQRLPDAPKAVVEQVIAETKQKTIAKFSVLSAILFVCYGGLLVYFKSKGGYRQVELSKP
jgi:MFS family permease